MSRAMTGSIVRPRLGPPGKSMRIKLFLGHLRSLRYENTKSLSITETFRRADAAVWRGFIACFFFPRTLGDKCFARLAILPRCEPVPAHRATLRYSGFVGANQSSPIPRASAKYSQYPRSFRHESHRRAVSVSDENVLRRSSEGYS